MTRRSVLGACLVFLVWQISLTARSQDTAVLPLPELKPLEHFIGTWEITARLPDGQSLKGKNVCSWILGGRFLQIHTTLLSPDGTSSVEMMSLLTYDTQKRVYRRWIFVSNGSVSEGEGTWDEATRTLRMVIRDPADTTSSEVVVSFPEAGREEWKIVIRDAQGNVQTELRGENRRQSVK